MTNESTLHIRCPSVIQIGDTAASSEITLGKVKIITESIAAESGVRCDGPLTTGSAVSNIWVNSRKHAGLLAASFVFCSLSAFAQTVPLGTATSFGVIAAQGITSTGATIISGDLGITPNNASSVTGFSFSTPPGTGIVTGTPHFADAVAVTAKNDAQAAYNTLASRPCTATISGDLGGRTLAPGVYCSASSMGLTGTLTLDSLGDSNAVFIFQVGSALTTASASQILMINGGQSCNVFWQIGSSATMGTGSSFLGNVLASSSVTMTTGSSSTGRLIGLTGAVTLDGTTVNVCALAPDNPSVSKLFSPSSIMAGATSVLTVTLINPNPTVATLTASLTDTLPLGVFVANPPNTSSTCGGSGMANAVAGGNSVSLGAGATIPANGSCSLSASVTAAAMGVYLNTVNAGALVTSNGNNASPAQATITVTLGSTPPPTVSVPTLSIWALLISAFLLMMFGVLAQRRSKRCR